MEEFGIKELYDITIKATRPIEFCGRIYDEGEPLVFLERAQFGLLNENRIRVFARGGKENRRLIMWETTQPIQMQIQQGVISKENLSALTNNYLTEQIAESIPYHKSFAAPLYTGEEHIVIPLPKYTNSNTKFFVYDNKGQRVNNKYLSLGIDEEISTQEQIFYKELWIQPKDIEEGIDYTKTSSFVIDSYITKPTQILNIGKDALRGYFRLEARTRVKDDIDGTEKTGIFVIPKMRIMSDLSIRLGDSISPFVYGFTFEGEPVGGYGESRVCDLYFLDEDLDADNLV